MIISLKQIYKINELNSISSAGVKQDISQYDIISNLSTVVLHYSILLITGCSSGVLTAKGSSCSTLSEESVYDIVKHTTQ